MADQNNPRNNRSTLFKRLTRLFSGPRVNYDSPSVVTGRNRDLQKYTFTSNTGREFKKKEYYNPFGDLSNKVLFQRNKQIRYNPSGREQNEQNSNSYIFGKQRL